MFPYPYKIHQRPDFQSPAWLAIWKEVYPGPQSLHSKQMAGAAARIEIASMRHFKALFHTSPDKGGAGMQGAGTTTRFYKTRYCADLWQVIEDLVEAQFLFAFPWPQPALSWWTPPTERPACH